MTVSDYSNLQKSCMRDQGVTTQNRKITEMIIKLTPIHESSAPFGKKTIFFLLPSWLLYLSYVCRIGLITLNTFSVQPKNLAYDLLFLPFSVFMRRNFHGRATEPYPLVTNFVLSVTCLDTLFRRPMLMACGRVSCQNLKFIRVLIFWSDFKSNFTDLSNSRNTTKILRELEMKRIL